MKVSESLTVSDTSTLNSKAYIHDGHTDRFKAREKNAEWRIDYFCVSDRIREKTLTASIHNEVFASYH